MNFLAMVSIIISAIFSFISLSDAYYNLPESTPAPTAIALEAPTPMPTPTPLPWEREGLEDLKQQITDITSAANGEWSVYAKYLHTNEYMSINEHSMPSASLIKLFIMNSVYKNINDGTLEKDENISNLLNSMITVSDNNSANELCTILGNGDMLKGFDAENLCTKAIDCTETIQQTDLQDNRANSKIPYIGRNYTSARDCGHLLELIYRKELYSEQYSNEMLELLKNQQRRHKIPYSIPKEIATANKTGEMTGVENDAAIIFVPDKEYILVVMSDALPNNNTGMAVIHKISEQVYNYFNSLPLPTPTPSPTPKIEHKNPEILPERKG